MSIEVQIQLIIISILFGFIFMIFYSLINEFFYTSKLRIIFEFPLFIISTIIYFMLIYKINGGLLNIYYPLFIIIGVLIYIYYYSNYFLSIYTKLHKKLIFFLKKHDIIRKRKEKNRHGKKKSTTNVRMEQKKSDINVITWSIDSSSSIRS